MPPQIVPGRLAVAPARFLLQICLILKSTKATAKRFLGELGLRARGLLVRRGSSFHSLDMCRYDRAGVVGFKGSLLTAVL